MLKTEVNAIKENNVLGEYLAKVARCFSVFKCFQCGCCHHLVAWHVHFSVFVIETKMEQHLYKWREKLDRKNKVV